MDRRRVRLERDAPRRDEEVVPGQGPQDGPGGLLALQRRAGNQAVRRLLDEGVAPKGGVQDKIKQFEALSRNGGTPKASKDQPTVEQPKVEEPEVEQPEAEEVVPFRLALRDANGVSVRSAAEKAEVEELNGQLKALRKRMGSGTQESKVRNQFGFDEHTKWTLEMARQAVDYLVSWREPTRIDETVVEIDGEQVRCLTADDEAEARRIIGGVRERFGVRISSAMVVVGNKRKYGESASEEVRAVPWDVAELQAVERGLAHMKDLFAGGEYNQRPEYAEGELAIGRTNKAADGIGYAEAFLNDGATLAAMSPKDRATWEGGQGTAAVGLYDGFKKINQYSDEERFSTHFMSDEKRRELQMEVIVVHELGHILFQPVKLAEWMKTFGWEDYDTFVSVGEPAPTNYGGSAAGEDMAESFGMFFVSPALLAKKAPKRFAFIDRWVKSWQPDQKAEFLVQGANSPGTHSRS